MSILIKNATIVQADGPHHLEKKDILIEKGIISKIAKSISTPAKKIIKGNHLHVSIGWMDIGSHSGQPGFEHRETIATLRATAAAGGYTNIAVFPNTDPVMDNSTALQLYKHQIGNSPVRIYPIGALSKNVAGVDIAEFIDMKQEGAIAFSDGLESVDNNGLLLRALQYVKSFEGLIIHHPHDKQIAGKGQMHEGIVSTSLGLNGVPSMAELSHVERDINLLEYAESKLLVHLISAKESVKAIKESKKSNEHLYCSVNYLNLISNDEALQEFDSNYKIQPPLRSKLDQKALINGIKSKVIDVITSNHFPLEDDLKKDAFQYTEAGAIGLQTCFPALWDSCKDQIELTQLIKCLAENPRKVLGLEIPVIKNKEAVDLVIFDLDDAWTFDKKGNHSLANNSPFLEKEFSAKIRGVVHGKYDFFS